VTRIEHERDLAAAARARPRGSLTRTVRAVLWSFFGVRTASDLERDMNELKPHHVIVAGLVVAALFVGLLIALVRWVISSGVAA
jgi:hypothetical protein